MPRRIYIKIINYCGINNGSIIVREESNYYISTNTDQLIWTTNSIRSGRNLLLVSDPSIHFYSLSVAQHLSLYRRAYCIFNVFSIFWAIGRNKLKFSGVEKYIKVYNLLPFTAEIWKLASRYYDYSCTILHFSPFQMPLYSGQ